MTNFNSKSDHILGSKGPNNPPPLKKRTFYDAESLRKTVKLLTCQPQMLY